MNIVNEIVKKIHADLSDRRGLRQEMQAIDDDIMQEMVETHRKIVEAGIQEFFSGINTHSET